VEEGVSEGAGVEGGTLGVTITSSLDTGRGGRGRLV
jgi:hypothetical protein